MDIGAAWRAYPAGETTGLALRHELYFWTGILKLFNQNLEFPFLKLASLLGLLLLGWNSITQGKVKRKEFICLPLPRYFITVGSQDRNSSRARTWWQEVNRGHEVCCLLACSTWPAQPAFSYFFTFLFISKPSFYSHSFTSDLKITFLLFVIWQFIKKDMCIMHSYHSLFYTLSLISLSTLTCTHTCTHHIHHMYTYHIHTHRDTCAHTHHIYKHREIHTPHTHTYTSHTYT